MKKTIIKQAILLFLLAGIVYACMQEEGLWESLNNRANPAITEAKLWYEKNKVGEGIEFRSTSPDKKKKDVKPVWENAFVEQDKQYKTVEVLLVADKGYGFISPDCYEKYQTTKDSRYLHSTTRLVIRTDLKTGETDGFIMSITPDLAYVEYTKYNPFRTFSYLRRDKKFSGFVHYYNMEGNIVNAWRFAEGKAYALIPTDKNSPDFSLKSTTGCIWYYYIEITETCYYTSHPGGEDTLTGCYITNYYEHWWQECDENGGSGNYGNGGDAGGSGNPNNPNPQITATLSGYSVITLMEGYGLNVSVNPSNTSITSVVYMINGQYTLQSSNSLSCNELSKKSGYWRIKAIINGSIHSNELDVEVKFPDVGKITNNGIVSGQMVTVWQATKNAASASGRSEKGFWIYVNTSSMSYECGSTISGGNVTGCEGTSSSINPGSPSENPSNSPLNGGKYAVAFFHTHTPLTYCTGVRKIGPSIDDDSWANGNQIPGLLYDYVGQYISSLDFTGFAIIGGHNINDPARTYTFGPTQKTTPNF